MHSQWIGETFNLSIFGQNYNITKPPTFWAFLFRFCRWWHGHQAWRIFGLRVNIFILSSIKQYKFSRGLRSRVFGLGKSFGVLVLDTPPALSVYKLGVKFRDVSVKSPNLLEGAGAVTTLVRSRSGHLRKSILLAFCNL